MRGSFKGDPNVFVFKPIPKGRGGRKKKMTHMEKVIQGGEQALLDELEKAILWARKLSSKEWRRIVASKEGLRGFIENTMAQPVKLCYPADCDETPDTCFYWGLEDCATCTDKSAFEPIPEKEADTASCHQVKNSPEMGTLEPKEKKEKP